MEIALAFVCGIVIGGLGVLLIFRSIARKATEEQNDDWWKNGSSPPWENENID